MIAYWSRIPLSEKPKHHHNMRKAKIKTETTHPAEKIITDFALKHGFKKPLFLSPNVLGDACGDVELVIANNDDAAFLWNHEKYGELLDILNEKLALHDLFVEEATLYETAVYKF